MESEPVQIRKINVFVEYPVKEHVTKICLPPPIVGTKNTITTTLANMTKDRFETLNFQNKMQVSVSGSKLFKGISPSENN
jgi:hypothetical protein